MSLCVSQGTNYTHCFSHVKMYSNARLCVFLQDGQPKQPRWICLHTLCLRAAMNILPINVWINLYLISGIMDSNNHFPSVSIWFCISDHQTAVYENTIDFSLPVLYGELPTVRDCGIWINLAGVATFPTAQCGHVSSCPSRINH